MASTAMRMRLDVEVADALGVRLDELLPRLDVGPHQLLERVANRGHVIDRDPQENTRRRIHRRLPQLLGVHLAKTLHPRGLGALAERAQGLVSIGLGLAPHDLHVLARALGHLEQRRLRHVQVALVDHRAEVAEEESEQQRPDVTPVDVGVGHGDNPVVPDLFDVEVVADPGAHRGDEVADRVRREHPVEPRLLDVEDLAAEREDRLRPAVAAALGGAAGGVALDDVELAERGVALGAVRELAGQCAGLEEALALDQVARLPRRLSRAGGGERLLDDAPSLRRALLEVLGQALRDRDRDVALDLRVPQLAFRLALKLRLEDLDADDRGETFAHVLAGEVRVRLLEDPGLARIAVEHVGQGGAKAGDVAAAFHRVDGVRERDDVLDEGVVVLERDLHLRALDLALDVEGRHVDDLLFAVEGAHERDDAAFEVEGLGDAQRFVVERDLEALVQVGHLAKAVADDLAVELRLRKDLGIGPEAHDRAGVVRLADRLHPGPRHAARVFLEVHLRAAVDPDLLALAQEVHRRDAHAVQAGADLVAAAAELPAGVQPGHHELEGGQTLLLVYVDRDAAPIVVDLDAAKNGRAS